MDCRVKPGNDDLPVDQPASVTRRQPCRHAQRLRLQRGERDRPARCAGLVGFLRQMAIRSHEQVFLHDPLVLLERALDPVDVLAVPVGHRGDDAVIAMSLGTKKQIRNPGHHLTNAELAHGLVPPTIYSPNFPIAALTSVATATKKRNKRDYFGTAASKMPPLLAPRGAPKKAARHGPRPTSRRRQGVRREAKRACPERRRKVC